MDDSGGSTSSGSSDSGFSDSDGGFDDHDDGLMFEHAAQHRRSSGFSQARSSHRATSGDWSPLAIALVVGVGLAGVALFLLHDDAAEAISARDPFEELAAQPAPSSFGAPTFPSAPFAPTVHWDPQGLSAHDPQLRRSLEELLKNEIAPGSLPTGFPSFERHNLERMAREAREGHERLFGEWPECNGPRDPAIAAPAARGPSWALLFGLGAAVGLAVVVSLVARASSGSRSGRPRTRSTPPRAPENSMSVAKAAPLPPLRSCGYCGSQVADDATACSQCGAGVIAS